MFEINPTQVGMVFAIIGFVWSSTWFLSKQFSNTLEKIYAKIEVLQTAFMVKFEQHEVLDNTRFERLQNSVWELRLKAVERGLVLDQEAKKGNSIPGT